MRLSKYKLKQAYSDLTASLIIRLDSLGNPSPSSSSSEGINSEE